MKQRNLKFKYRNWKGDEHVYVIEPTGAECATLERAEVRERVPVLHGNVVTRDGDPRPEMGPIRCRTFRLAELREVEEVEAA